MQLQGITIDFYDKKTCGLLPELCLQWDERYDEIEDNEELVKYWEDNVDTVLSQTKNVVSGNIDHKSVIYSADEQAIAIIEKAFKELKLQTINYDEITKCEHCLTHDYLDNDFIPPHSR